MSAEENLENTKKAYTAFQNGDVAGAMENLSDEIEWVVPGESAVSGTYRGKDEVLGFWMKLAEKNFTTTPEHFLGDDERVVVLTRTTVADQAADSVDVMTFRDGKVVRFQSALDTALQARIWPKT